MWICCFWIVYNFLLDFYASFSFISGIWLLNQSHHFISFDYFKLNNYFPFNHFQVIMSSGSEYLLHSDSTEVAQQWFDVLSVVAKKVISQFCVSYMCHRSLIWLLRWCNILKKTILKEGGPRQEITGEGLVKFKSINEEQSSSLELNKSELLKTRQKSGNDFVVDNCK